MKSENKQDLAILTHGHHQEWSLLQTSGKSESFLQDLSNEWPEYSVNGWILIDLPGMAFQVSQFGKIYSENIQEKHYDQYECDRLHQFAILTHGHHQAWNLLPTLPISQLLIKVPILFGGYGETGGPESSFLG